MDTPLDLQVQYFALIPITASDWSILCSVPYDLREIPQY